MKTDWNNYYSKKRSLISIITQKITKRYLRRNLKEVSSDFPKAIELGGANSDFVTFFNTEYQVKEYDIIDNSKIGLGKTSGVNKIINFNLTNNTDSIKELFGKYDLVVSFGLIEHFEGSTLKTIIDNHFLLCKTSGYILITFPTPTLQYRITRVIMERLNIWAFHDEKPILYNQVRTIFEKHGSVIFEGINYLLPLSQQVVLIKKN